LGEGPDDTFAVKNMPNYQDPAMFIHQGEESATGVAFEDDDGEWWILFVFCPGVDIGPQNPMSQGNNPDTNTYFNPYLAGEGFYQDPLPDVPDALTQMQPVTVDMLAL
jgi:hypothetical protein